MRHWAKRIFVAAAPLLLAGCLWGPGDFTSNLTVRKDGSFALDYRGEIVIQVPPDAATGDAWKPQMAHCMTDAKDGKMPEERPCTEGEIAEQEKSAAEKLKRAEDMAKALGLPGFDDASNRAFAEKLMKYAGWRSVVFRGNGVFDVDYHFEGEATQDFVFPAMPGNELIVPFVAIRRRDDGTVLVTAPALSGGGARSLMEGIAAAGNARDKNSKLVSRAKGRFTVITDGEFLTNNSEEGPAPNTIGRQIHWDIGPGSKKAPETLIRL